MSKIEELVLSVGIVAYNESSTLNGLLDDILKQTYPKNLTELLFIDSISEDNTAEIFNDFKKNHENEYKSIKVLENKGKIQACGWNVAIDNFCGDALLRIDAHAKLTPNFLENNAKCLKSGEYVCGGKRPNITADKTAVGDLVLLSDLSLFGGSFANYHTAEKKQYTDSVFHGCYRRTAIEKTGHFNEKLGRTEDNDFNYRIRAAGYKICYDPEIVSYQYSRASIFAAVKQKFGNGFWVAKTVYISPKCISLFHFVPFCFVAALLISLILSFTVCTLPLLLLLAVYFTADIALSLVSIVRAKPFHTIYLLLPFMLFALHIAYGVGSVFGFLSFGK